MPTPTPPAGQPDTAATLDTLGSIRWQFDHHRGLAERAIAQLDDASLSRTLGDDQNSIAVIVQHLAGNLRSRFSDFLGSDGEKPWRERDQEFEAAGADRASLLSAWAAGWATLESCLGELTPADLTRSVTIRGVALSVAEALARSLAHVAYHVGQIVLLARWQSGPAWRSLSIPRGGSRAYDPRTALEKGSTRPAR